MASHGFVADDRDAPSTLHARYLGPVILAVAMLAAIFFYWFGLVSVVEAWERPEYSHGYLIPPIALFLLLSALRDRPALQAGQSTIPGLVLVVLGIAVGLLGNLARIPDVVTYGHLTLIAGFVLIVARARNGIRFWAPVAYLGFMLPLPNFLYWKLSTSLQFISSKIGVAIIDLFGVPVYLDGNIIDLGVYKLQVAEACSGLNYLFPLMSFGFLFAVLYRGPVWHKITLFVSAIPITVAMNSLRIGIIGLLVDRYGIEQAEGFLHFFEGWVIFVACITILYGEAFLLQRVLSRRRAKGPVLDINTRGLIDQFARLENIVATPALIIATAAVVVAALAWHFTPAQAAIAPDRRPLAIFPMEFGPWRGSTQRLEPDIERVLGADDYLVATYNNGNAGLVSFFVAYYDSQTEGSGIHSPEVCIPAGGWEISKWQTVTTGFRLPSGEPLRVNRALIRKGLNSQLVYYWFEQRGRQLTNDFAAKGYAVWDSITKGRTDGALVRLVTPVVSNEPEAQADARLVGFLDQIFVRLDRFVPD